MRRPRRVRTYVLILVSTLLVLGGLLAGAIMLNSPGTPMAFIGLNTRVADALRGQIGPDWSVDVGQASLSWRGTGPGLDVEEVTIRNPAGQVVLRAPRGAIEVDGLSLAVGQFRPTSVALAGLDMKMFVGADGSLKVDSGAGAYGADALGQEAPSASSIIALVNQVEGLFGQLGRAELRDARLILVERNQAERVAFQNVRVAVSRAENANRRIEVNVEGRTGPWTMALDISGAPGTPRDIGVSFKDVALADLWLFGGQTVVPVDPRSALSGQAMARFSRDGQLLTLDAEAGARGGRIGLAVGEVDHVPLDKLSLSLAKVAGGVDIAGLRFIGGGSDVNLAGTVRAGDDGNWNFALNAKDAVLSGAAAQDAPVRLDTALFEGMVATDGKPSRLSLTVETGGAKARAGMLVEMGQDGPNVALDVDSTPIDVRSALRLWPAFAATGTRLYLVDSLTRGIADRLTIKVKLPARIIKTFFDEQPWPDDSLEVLFSVRGAEFKPSPDLPPLTEASLGGRITATTASLQMPAAIAALPGGRFLSVSEGAMVSANTTGKRPLATVDMRLKGKADALFEFIASDAFKPVMASDLDPANVSGSVDLKATLDVKLGAALDAREVGAKVAGAFTNLTIDNAFGTEKLENANLAFSFIDNALQMKGEGRLLGLPATIDVKPGVAPAPSSAVVSMVIDEAARKKRGINLGRKLSGPIALKATAPLGVVGAKARVEADLTRAAIDDLVPGWKKAAGRPARLAFTFGNKPGAVVLEDIILESPTLDARGQAELKPDLTPVSAEFDAVKLSPGDNLSVKLTRAGAVTKLAVSGAVFDARPFLKALQGPSPGTSRNRAEEAESSDIDIEMSVPIVTGFNDEAITQASLSLSQRGKDIRELKFAGRIGSSPVSLELVRDPSRNAWFVLDTRDAGALLRYVDLYRRMVGGELAVRMTAFEPVQTGDVTIREFALRNEPALGRIISEPNLGPTASDERNLMQPARRIDPSTVQFTTLRGDFSRSASRLEIRDAVMWGALVGLNIAGSIDYGRDRVALDGTYVPAYGLNNAFSKVPLFGPLLGGGATEGLFAVSFRISGAASAPTLTVNPLSFVAPGIFRKFFDALRGDAQTGSTPIPTR